MKTNIATNLGFHGVHSVTINKPRRYDRSDGKVFYATEILLFDKDWNFISIDLFGDNEFEVKINKER